ncbi:hypothetical protein D9M68_902730 [compost metagenome]
MDGGGAEHGTDDEIPRRLAATQRCLGLGLQGEHALGVTQQHLAGRRQLQALALAQEQLDAQGVLQLAQARGEVRRHPVQAACRPGDGALFGHGLEDTELAEFHDGTIHI